MSILNKAEFRRIALEKGKEKYKNTPVYIPTRVSEKFINDAEAAVSSWIDGQLNSRPTKGVTL